MADRVGLFIDYQNTYREARHVYHDHAVDPPWLGQVNPGDVGRLLVERSPYDRELVGVRIYRGLPSSEKDPKGYGAARAQLAHWDRDPLVTPRSRPLRYPDDWPHSPPEEKGIDVQLAVDFVIGAAKGTFDVGIIMSLDTDLKPAMEMVLGQLHGIRVEVAAWNSPTMNCSRLSLKGEQIWCHWLQPDDYAKVTDSHDYTTGAPPA